jgi:hypothetical protein
LNGIEVDAMQVSFADPPAEQGSEPAEPSETHFQARITGLGKEAGSVQHHRRRALSASFYEKAFG